MSGLQKSKFNSLQRPGPWSESTVPSAIADALIRDQTSTLAKGFMPATLRSDLGSLLTPHSLDGALHLLPAVLLSGRYGALEHLRPVKPPSSEREHALRVGQLSERFALRAAYSPSAAASLGRAAALHDLGKAMLEPALLTQVGPLSDLDLEKLHDHTLWGSYLLRHHRGPCGTLARRVAMTHHERWDGTGYPLGLSRDAIPLEGRLVALVDVYDALHSERPYKAAWEAGRVRRYLENEAGGAFDPALTALFLNLLRTVAPRA